jgi:hypothetical protein
MLARCSDICCLLAIVAAAKSKCLSCHPEIKEYVPLKKFFEQLLSTKVYTVKIQNGTLYLMGHFDNCNPVVTLNHSVLGTTHKAGLHSCFTGNCAAVSRVSFKLII